MIGHAQMNAAGLSLAHSAAKHTSWNQISKNKIHPSLCNLFVLWKAVQRSGWSTATSIKHFSWPLLRHIASVTTLVSIAVLRSKDTEVAGLCNVFRLLITVSYWVSRQKLAWKLNWRKSLLAHELWGQSGTSQQPKILRYFLLRHSLKTENKMYLENWWLSKEFNFIPL